MDDARPTTAPSRADVGRTLLGAVIAVGVGAAMRLPGLGRAYTADEVGTMIPGGFLAQLNDPETGVNPPLWRWLTTARLPAAEALAFGRELSLVLNLGAVALGVVVGRLVGGRWWTGWLAGALLAVHPWSVWEAPTARVYGLLTLVMQAHLLAVAVWLGQPSRRASVAVALTAVLVPWTHYAALPWMALVGAGVAATVPGRRRLIALYVPAALGFLPLLQRIFAATSRRVPPQRPVGEVVDMVASMDVVTRKLPHLVAGPTSLPWNPSLPVVLLGLLLIGVLLAGRRSAPALRMAWWSAVAVPVGVAVIAPYQLVRPTTTMLMVVAAAPLLAGAPGRLPRAWLRLGAAAAITGVIAWGTVLRWDTFIGSDGTSDAVRLVAARIHADEFPPGPILLHPRGEGLPLYFYLTGRYARGAPKGEGCDDCFVVRGRTILPRDVLSSTEAPWVLTFDTRAEAPTGCASQDAPEGARLWRCTTPSESPDPHTIR